MRSLREDLVPWTVVAGLLMAAIASVALAQRQTGVPVVQLPSRPAIVAPQAQQILQTMARFFKNVKSLRTEVTVQTDFRTRNGIQPATMRYVLALQRPDRFAMTQITSFASPTIVCDGDSLYTFQPATLQYMQKKAPASLDSLDRAEIAEAGAGLGTIMHWILQSDPYQAILEGTFNANYLGQDMTDGIRTQHVQLIQAGWHVDLWVQMDRPVFRRIDLTRLMDPSWTVGGSAPGICIVRGSNQYAVDPSQMPVTGGTYLAMPPGLPSAKLNPQGPGGVLVELPGEIDPAKTQPDVSMIFGHWLVDGNLPESVFQFTPPRGARKVGDDDQANKPAGDSLQGQPVPPATMNLMHGGRVTPSSMKGKVLVLGFWSVGTPSSKFVLQAMAQIANQYCARGVAVYAVNVGDTPAKVREYLNQASIHVAVATDPAGNTARQYKIQAPPQVMIVDRRGIVQGANVPLGADLMKELQRDVEVVLAGKDLTAEKK